MIPSRHMTGPAVWLLAAAALVGGCTPPAAPLAQVPGRPAQFAQQPGSPDLTPDGLQTAMFGPPPRTQIDPLVRCRVNCPPAQRAAVR